MSDLTPAVELQRTVAELRRTNRNLASVQQRVKAGHLTGRNAAATEQTIQAHLERGRRLVSALVGLSGYVDDIHDSVIERFWTLERRAYGIDMSDPSPAASPGRRLVYLKTCAAWTFTDRLPGEAAFYELRDAAVDAAHRHGLIVSSDGTVS